MEHEIVDRIGALLKEHGFEGVAVERGRHSATVSAEMGETRAVFHLTDRDEVPSATSANPDFQPSEAIKEVAGLIGGGAGAEPFAGAGGVVPGGTAAATTVSPASGS